MTMAEFLEEQVKSYKYAIRYISTASPSLYREIIPMGGSAHDTIELLRVLQEVEFKLEFHRGWIRVWAPHNEKHDHGWDCTYGLTLHGCEVFRPSNTPVAP